MSEKEAGLPALTNEQVELIKQTIAGPANLSDNELRLFLYSAKRFGLDPLARQIHAIKRGGRLTIQTGIDGYRAIAERTGQCAGQDAPLYQYDDRGGILSCTVTVYRMVEGNRVGFSATAFYDEYVQPSSPLWGKMRHTMIAKCAEALALRKAFPNDLSGLYTQEEMMQADVEPVETAAVHTAPLRKVEIDPPKSTGWTDKRPTAASSLRQEENLAQPRFDAKDKQIEEARELEDALFPPENESVQQDRLKLRQTNTGKQDLTKAMPVGLDNHIKDMRKRLANVNKEAPAKATENDFFNED